MILDTSALLAVVFNEKKGVQVAELMEKHVRELAMSTVNLAETLIKIADKQPKTFQQIREEILSSSIRFVPPTVNQARIAAEARLKYPINLGDCFVYALAKEEQDIILSLDSTFKKTDVRLVALS